MLRKSRIIVAWVVFALAVLLVADFSGALHLWFGWVARVQLLPAVLAVNVAALVVVALLTVLFGRVYCSTLCPLGIMQDGVSWASGRRKGKKARFRYSKPLTWLRYGLLVLAIVGLVAGLSAVVSLLDPWGNFGRIAQNFFAPVWRAGNNLLAWVAERADSYAFHTTEVYIKSGIAFGVAAIWLVGLAVLAWWKGRVYCNSICPVGTFLGLISPFAVFKPVIDEAKCTKCGVCEKKCKSECIDSKEGLIDRSRCVVCFDCLESCNFGAITYRAGKGAIVIGVGVIDPKQTKEMESGLADLESEIKKTSKKGMNRRNFFSVAALAAAATPAAVKAQQVERILYQVDGGLADLVEKKRPERATAIVPPGAQSAANMKQHCVACQLCVAACPNNVLVPSSKLATLMQPEMTFEKGYCRPECVECGEVCPAGAITRITPADKTAISVGNAVWERPNCIPVRDGVACTECERHCPTKAISMVPIDPEAAAAAANAPRSPWGPPPPPVLCTPVIDNTLCIGCGACENLCPSNPYSAIHVEGNVSHRSV